MQYRGFNFTILQAIDRGVWKWAVELPERRRHGESGSREDALIEVKKTIDKALAPKKLRLSR